MTNDERERALHLRECLRVWHEEWGAVPVLFYKRMRYMPASMRETPEGLIFTVQCCDETHEVLVRTDETVSFLNHTNIDVTHEGVIEALGGEKIECVKQAEFFLGLLQFIKDEAKMETIFDSRTSDGAVPE